MPVTVTHHTTVVWDAMLEAGRCEGLDGLQASTVLVLFLAKLQEFGRRVLPLTGVMNV
jgi:hypothetical protein